MRQRKTQSDFVTKEQIEKARAVNLLDYVQRTEPGNIIPSAPGEYMLKDHDSLKFSKGKFHWHSRGIGGINAIDYLVKVRNMEFKDAVRELAGEDFTITHATTTGKRAPPVKPKSQDSVVLPMAKPAQARPDFFPVPEGRFFMLPEADSHNDDVIEYLKGRGIEENIINDCIDKGLLYQNRKRGCVFVGFDAGASPKFACERGTQSDYKKDVAGSNKAFNFCMPPKTSDSHTHYESARLYVFESAVDCLSHASITQIGGTDWDGYRLALGGVSSLALNTFLENNPQITHVYLALDNDKPGQAATERICNELLSNEQYNHINIFKAPPPIGKDYNDTLMALREKIKERKLQTDISNTSSHPQKSNVIKKGRDVVL